MLYLGGHLGLESSCIRVNIVFTDKIAIQYKVLAFRHLLLFLQSDCENAVPFSLSNNFCYLSENTVLEYAGTCWTRMTTTESIRRPPSTATNFSRMDCSGNKHWPAPSKQLQCSMC
jgi:hypothetical protein